ncbi:hypothetical protein EDD17DRAFT_409798 [Pisolithus thermaeus]|nr:hypothetical protein EDD17DRAFT_409798 [Pisolithus thermaeus]
MLSVIVLGLKGILSAICRATMYFANAKSTRPSVFVTAAVDLPIAFKYRNVGTKLCRSSPWGKHGQPTVLRVESVGIPVQGLMLERTGSRVHRFSTGGPHLPC